MSPVGENSIQLFERLLLFVHTKVISRSISQRYLDGIHSFEWLGLSVQKELYTAARMAVFV